MSEVSDTADLVEASILGALEPRFMKNEDGREFLVLPPNAASANSSWTSTEITMPNAIAPIAPKIITQAVQLQQVESLVEYVNRFKNSNSVLFADIASSTILSIIDYHISANAPAPANVEGGVPASAAPEARHTKHTAILRLPHSLEWDTWKAIDGRLMSHVDFANFIEENGGDVMPLVGMRDGSGNQIEDAPSTVLELVRELQVKSSFGASSAIRNGDYVSIEMQKGDDVSTKRNVALPNMIHLIVPVYFGEDAVQLDALIRRKVEDGSLKLGVKLVRPEQVRQDEFKRIVHGIAHEVGLATHYGKPTA